MVEESLPYLKHPLPTMGDFIFRKDPTSLDLRYSSKGLLVDPIYLYHFPNFTVTLVYS